METEFRYMIGLIVDTRNNNNMKLALCKDMLIFSFTGVEMEWDRIEMEDNELF